MRMFRHVMSGLSLATLAIAPISAQAAGEGELEAAFDTATWYFQCPSDHAPVPDPTPTSLILDGAGPHYNLRGKLLGTPLVIKGKICPPASQQRDIVLAVDVSGSMSQNDPMIGGSCGRFAAVNAVLDSLTPNVSNVALVTFDDGVRVAATRFHQDKTSLLAEIASVSRTTVQNALCYNGGGTYYQYPLGKAETLFLTGRRGATKELFIVSDGLPSDAAPGQTIASRLKTQGVVVDTQTHLVTIGTIMLGRVDDTYLRTQIASLDAQGTPLHAVVADADDLAETLGRMSSSTLVGATIAHGPDNVTTRAPLDVMPYLQPDYTFEMPAFVLGIDGRQNFYDMIFEYWDTNHNRQTVGGRIYWLD